MKVLRVILVALGCLHLCGGNHGLMQAIAWGTMLVEYSAEKGLAQGVSDTFDGEHPCDLCHSIAKVAQSEAPDEPLPSQKILERLELKPLFPAEMYTTQQQVGADLPAVGFPRIEEVSVTRRDSPATPPPRFS